MKKIFIVIAGLLLGFTVVAQHPDISIVVGGSSVTTTATPDNVTLLIESGIIKADTTKIATKYDLTPLATTANISDSLVRIDEELSDTITLDEVVQDLDTVHARTITTDRLYIEAAQSGKSVVYGLNTSSGATNTIGISGLSSGGVNDPNYFTFYGVRGLSTGTGSGNTNVGLYGVANSSTYRNFGLWVDEGDSRIDGNVIKTPVNTGNITAGTGITTAMMSGVMIYNGASAIDISANPQIAAGTTGQIIIIVGSSDTNTLTLDDGTGLALSAQMVLGINDVITLMYVTTLGWTEISRSNN